MTMLEIYCKGYGTAPKDTYELGLRWRPHMQSVLRTSVCGKYDLSWFPPQSVFDCNVAESGREQQRHGFNSGSNPKICGIIFSCSFIVRITNQIKPWNKVVLNIQICLIWSSSNFHVGYRFSTCLWLIAYI